MKKNFKKRINKNKEIVDKMNEKKLQEQNNIDTEMEKIIIESIIFALVVEGNENSIPEVVSESPYYKPIIQNIKKHIDKGHLEYLIKSFKIDEKNFNTKVQVSKLIKQGKEEEAKKLFNSMNLDF